MANPNQDIYNMGQVNLAGSTPIQNSMPAGSTAAPINAPLTMPKVQPGVPTAEQNLAAYNAAQNKTIVPTTLSKPNNVITASTLGTEKIDLPYSKTNSTAKPVMNYAGMGAQSMATPYQDQNKTLSDMMLQILPNLQGQATELETQKKAANLPQLQQKLQDYNSQILTKQAELNQDDMSLAQGLQNIEDQTIPMEFITGQQLSVAKRAELARGVKVSEVNMLNALALSAQGNIALATQQATDATNAKFAPFKEMYALLQEQQKAIQPFVTSEEKKIAEINSNIAAYNLKKLDISQKQEENFMNMIMKAPTEYGASPEMINEALNVYKQTGDVYEAAQYLTGYGGEQFTQGLKLQDAIRGTSYSSPTQISVENGYTFEDYKKGIAKTESSNNYNAIGPATSSGDKAYGKYQVMGANIPSWTKQALGYSMTPQQFLKSPEAQEKVFENQALNDYAKHGNWADVASVWFSGKPLNGNNASDGYNTVPQYVTKVLSGMGVNQSAASQNLSMVTNPNAEIWGKAYQKSGDIKDVPKQFQTMALAWANQNVDNSPEVQNLVVKVNQINNAMNSSALSSVVGPNMATRASNSILGVAGRTLTGAATGAAAGSVIPGAGTFMGGVVGAGAGLLGALAQNSPFFSGEAQNFLGDIKQITDREFIDNLIKAKAQGATFGALTEREGQALRDAATKLNTWAVKDGDGNVVGYNIDEENFLKELNNIKTLAQKGITKAGGNILGGSPTDIYLDAINQQLSGSNTSTPVSAYASSFTR